MIISVLLILPSCEHASRRILFVIDQFMKCGKSKLKNILTLIKSTFIVLRRGRFTPPHNPLPDRFQERQHQDGDDSIEK